MSHLLPLVQLEEKSRLLRKKVLTMIYQAGSGHPAGSLSCLDILITLYFGGILRYNPKKPTDPNQDQFVLSAGHYAPAFYAVLAEAGFFSPSLLNRLRDLDSPLQGHPERGRLPGIVTSSGLLGQGLSVAIGLALAKPKQNIFVLSSDGEQQEGQIWEAAMTAAKYHLRNLILIIDHNKIQIDGLVEKIMPLGNLKRKYESFGWRAFETDGHNFRQLTIALHRAIETRKQPAVVIAHTVAGRGVSFMEGKPEWHGKKLTKKEYQQAIKELGG